MHVQRMTPVSLINNKKNCRNTLVWGPWHGCAVLIGTSSTYKKNFHYFEQKIRFMFKVLIIKLRTTSISLQGHFNESKILLDKHWIVDSILIVDPLSWFFLAVFTFGFYTLNICHALLYTKCYWNFLKSWMVFQIFIHSKI